MSSKKKDSHALPVRYYRDPLEVLLAKEAGTCAGCAFRDVLLGVEYCRAGKRFGKRCKRYAEAARG